MKKNKRKVSSKKRKSVNHVRSIIFSTNNQSCVIIVIRNPSERCRISGNRMLKNQGEPSNPKSIPQIKKYKKLDVKIPTAVSSLTKRKMQKVLVPSVSFQLKVRTRTPKWDAKDVISFHSLKFVTNVKRRRAKNVRGTMYPWTTDHFALNAVDCFIFKVFIISIYIDIIRIFSYFGLFLCCIFFVKSFFWMFLGKIYLFCPAHFLSTYSSACTGQILTISTSSAGSFENLSRLFFGLSLNSPSISLFPTFRYFCTFPFPDE